jgi:hypothetical protein
MARHDRNNKNKQRDRDMDREDRVIGDEGELGGETTPTRERMGTTTPGVAEGDIRRDTDLDEDLLELDELDEELYKDE